MSRVKISTDGPKRASREKSPYIRVTSVLNFIDSQWYQWWLKGLAAKCPNPIEEAERITEQSAAFGTEVHKIVADYLMGLDVRAAWIDNRVYTCAGHLISWIKQTGAKPIIIDGKPSVEFEVISESLGLIGHFDCVLKVGESLWIIDLKTSSKIKKANALQLAAYAKMLQIQYGIIVNDGAILRVEKDPAKDPQFEIEEYHSLSEKYWPVFLNCLDVYSYFNNKGKYAKPKKVSFVHEELQQKKQRKIKTT